MRTNIIFVAGAMISHHSSAALTPKSHIGIMGIDFQSQVGLDYGHQDNVTYQPDDKDIIGSDFQNLRPVIKAVGGRVRDKYLLMYSGDYRRYHSDPADNYADHFFRFNGAWHYGGMHGFLLNLEEVFGHEERGRGITEGFLPQQVTIFGINQPLSTHLLNGALRYSYGAPEGRGKVEVALLFKKLRFDHVENTKKRDIDFYNYILEQAWHENSLVVELFDQSTPKKRFRYSFIANQRHYEVNPEKDNGDYYLGYGVKSQLTGKTSIGANVALLYKTFGNNLRPQDVNGLNWDIQAEWKPLKHTVLALHASQHIKDLSEIGSYTLVSKYSVAYQHFWLADRFSTTFDYSYAAEDNKKQVKDRHDKNKTFTFTLRYDFRPSIGFEVKYQRNKLYSNKDIDSFFIGPDSKREVFRTLDYDQSMIMFISKVQICNENNETVRFPVVEQFVGQLCQLDATVDGSSRQWINGISAG